MMGGSAGEYAVGIGSGAASGAAMGSVIGPWGTVIGGAAGGLIGGLSTFFGNKDEDKEEEKARQAAAEAQRRQKKEALANLLRRKAAEAGMPTAEMEARMMQDGFQQQAAQSNQAIDAWRAKQDEVTPQQWLNTGMQLAQAGGAAYKSFGGGAPRAPASGGGLQLQQPMSAPQGGAGVGMPDPMVFNQAPANIPQATQPGAYQLPDPETMFGQQQGYRFRL